MGKTYSLHFLWTIRREIRQCADHLEILPKGDRYKFEPIGVTKIDSRLADSRTCVSCIPKRNRNEIFKIQNISKKLQKLRNFLLYKTKSIWAILCMEMKGLHCMVFTAECTLKTPRSVLTRKRVPGADPKSYSDRPVIRVRKTFLTQIPGHLDPDTGTV